MTDSDFVFENGNPIDVGTAVKNDFVFIEGELVSDGDVSDFASIEGRGLGPSDVAFAAQDTNVQNVTKFSRVEMADLDSGTTSSGASSVNPQDIVFGNSAVFVATEENVVTMDPVDLSQTDSTVDQSSRFNVVGWHDGHIYAGNEDGTLYEYDPSGMSLVDSYTFVDVVQSFSSDDTHLYFGGGNASGDNVWSYDRQSDTTEASTDVMTEVRGAAVRGTGDLFVGGNDGIRQLSRPGLSVNGKYIKGNDVYAVTSDGTYIYTGDWNNEVHRIKPGETLKVTTLPAKIHSITTDGSFVYAGCQDGVVYKLDVSDLTTADSLDLGSATVDGLTTDSAP
jgi:hypothetical protein